MLTLATAFTTYFNLQIKQGFDQQLTLVQLDREKIALLSDQVSIDINQKRFSNEQFLLLNREVREALAHADCDQHLLLAMLVDKTLAEEVTLRDSIRSIIKNKEPNCSASTYIEKEEKNEQEYDVQQKQVFQMEKQFRIDIFYLDDLLAEAKPRAKKYRKPYQSNTPIMRFGSGYCQSPSMPEVVIELETIKFDLIQMKKSLLPI